MFGFFKKYVKTTELFYGTEAETMHVITQNFGYKQSQLGLLVVAGRESCLMTEYDFRGLGIVYRGWRNNKNPT